MDKNRLKNKPKDKPVLLENYSFHYHIMNNDCNELKKGNYPIYNENGEGLNGFQLAAKLVNDTNNIDMLKCLINNKNYRKYIYKNNSNNENLLEYFPVNNLIKELYEELKKNKLDINKLINSKESNNISYLDKVFINGDYNLIEWIFDKIKIEWNKLHIETILNIFLNNKISNKELIKILDTINEKYNKLLNINDSLGRNILYLAIEKNDLEIIKQLHKYKIKFDYYIVPNDNVEMHPFLDAYIEEKYDIAEYIWNCIKDNYDYSQTDSNKRNLAINMVLCKKDGIYKKEIHDDIIKRNNRWSDIDIDKKTIIDYMVEENIDEYKDLIPKDIEIRYNNKLKIDNKWKKYLSKMKIYKFVDDIILKKYKFVDHNKFNARIEDLCLYMYYLNKKYKELYLPIDKKIEIKIELDKYSNLYKFIKDYKYYPFMMFVDNKLNNLFIHPNLNKLMEQERKRKKYKFGVVMICVFVNDMMQHAEMLVYDFINSTIEHFDPYGDTSNINNNFDDRVETKITNGTKFKFIKLKDFLPQAGFQLLSDEENTLNTKPGDYGGYCLAWCLWYLEHRILNYKCTQKYILPKLLDKIITKENKLSIYIRNYANYINNYKLDILKKIGIDKYNLTNEEFDIDNLNKINNFIKKKLLKKIKLN